MTERAREWPFQLTEGDGLALLAAESASDPCLVDAPVELTKDIWFLKSHSYALPHHWREFVGSYAADRIEKSPFCLAMLGRQYDDVNALARRLDQLYFCVQIHGLPGLGEFWIAQAACLDGRLEPRGIWPGRHCHLPEVEGFATTMETMTAAVRMLPNAILAFDAEGEWQRLQRGKHALSRAMSEPWEDFRLHHYVQAMEAIVAPGSGAMTGIDFRARVALFTEESPEAASAIDDMYELRCNTEHLLGWTTPRRKGKWQMDERKARLRLWQAENLTFHIYRRILSRPNLLTHFRDDDAIKYFWGPEGQTLRSHWGEPLDLARFEWKKSSGQLGVRDYSLLASFPGGLAMGERGDVPPWPRDVESRADVGAE